MLVGSSHSAHAHDSFSDPAGSAPLIGAVSWLRGKVATVIAVIAVASVGFVMLTGSMNWRYDVTVIFGCFILFGAATMVAKSHPCLVGQPRPASRPQAHSTPALAI